MRSKYIPVYCRRKDKRFSFSVFKVCLFFALISFMGSVFWVVQSTFAFFKISSLEKEEDKLIQEKTSLEEKLFKADSLNNVVSVSHYRGFTSMVNFVYLSNEKPVAKLP